MNDKREFMSIDWSQIYKKYRGSWIALKSDEKTVVSSAKTAKEAWDEAQKKGQKKPILFKVPLELISYVGQFR